jgi:hypothetical protein
MAVTDTAAFFRVPGFAIPAIYTDPSGASHPINVLFDRHVEVAQAGSQDIQMYAGTALCQTGDLPGVTTKATLALNGITYKIIEVNTDAIGTTQLILSKD